MMKMPKIKFDKKDFKEKVKELAKKHDVPEKIMEEWLEETYELVEKKYRDNMKKTAKEALRKEKDADNTGND